MTKSHPCPLTSEEAAKFGRDLVVTRHNLLETGLFSEEAIAELIEKYPPHLYNLNSMGKIGDGYHWIEGTIGDVPGKDVLEAIRTKRIWLNLRDVMDVDPRYKALMQDMFDGFAEQVPGFHPFKTRIGILVSSPGAQVYYHADIPGQGLLQLGGRKTIWIYPRDKRFLPEAELERAILGESEEDITYDPSYDSFATRLELEPGDMATWALNAPHRVENADCMNISLTIEYWTTEIRNAYAVRYANGLLRKAAPLRPFAASTEQNFLNVYPKAALAFLHKKLNLGATSKFERQVQFELDTEEETGLRMVEPYRKAA